MLIETIVRGTEEDLAVVLIQNEQDLAQIFKLTLLLCLGLKRIPNFIQFLDVLFVIQGIIFLLVLLQLLSLFEWFFGRSGPVMLSQPLFLEFSKADLEVLRLTFKCSLDRNVRYVAH